jgi:hypothetical protein
MAEVNSTTASVIAAQVILKRTKPNLLIDGKWGNYTNSVYIATDPATKGEVDRVLAGMGTDAKKLFDAFQTIATVRKAVNAQPNDSHSWVPKSDVSAYIRRYCDKFGASDLVGAISSFLDIEARKQVTSGVTFYDAKSVSPNRAYLGLFQMGRAAWSDASDFINKGDFGFVLPSFDNGVFNPEMNAAAGVAYAVINAKRLSKRKLPVTANTLYGAHNQGVAGFAAYVAQGQLIAPKQSQMALRVLADARKESLRVA